VPGVTLHRGVLGFGISLGFLEESSAAWSRARRSLAWSSSDFHFDLSRALSLGVVSSSMLGQNKWSAMGFLIVICSVVQPAVASSADWPEIMWPAGTGSKDVMPLARVTGSARNQDSPQSTIRHPV